MQTIVTKYHGCTATKPARVSATSTGGTRLYITADGYSDHTYNNNDHERAAYMLAAKLGWMPVKLISGGIDGGMVWVILPKEYAQ